LLALIRWQDKIPLGGTFALFMEASLPFAAVVTQSVQINEMNNASANYFRNIKTSNNNKRSIYVRKVLISFKPIEVGFGKLYVRQRYITFIFRTALELPYFFVTLGF